MPDEAKQKIYSTVNAVSAYVETEVVVTRVVALTSCVCLGIELAGVVVVLDEYTCFALIDVIEFHDSLHTLWHWGMKEDAELVGMVFEDMKTAAPDDDARLLLGDFSHRFGLCVEELPGGDVGGSGSIFADAYKVLIKLCEVFPPGGSLLFQADGFFFSEIEFLGYGFQYLLVNEFDIEPSCQFCANFMSSGTKLAVDGDDVLIVEVHSVGL